MSKKKEYIVTYAILGSVSMTVKAESKAQAKEAFWASVEAHGGNPLDNPDFDEVEYDFVEEVIRGNVFHGSVNKATVEAV